MCGLSGISFGISYQRNLISRPHYPTRAGNLTIGLGSDYDSNRGDSRCTIVNEVAGVALVLGLLPHQIEFHGAAVLDLVEPGLFAKKRRGRPDASP
jgi:hypothetical protein